MSSPGYKQESSDFLSAGDPARLFIIGGMLLVITGMIFGDLYAVFILHPNVADIGREMGAAVSAAAAGNADSVFSHFGAVGGFLENAGTKKDAHVHMIHAGYLAFLLAFLQPKVALGERARLLLARSFLWASVILPVSIFLIHYVGLVYSPLETIGWASIFADLAGLVLIIVLLAELAGLVRHAGGRGEQNAELMRLDGGESRTLVIGGTFLMLAGFLFGAIYAGGFMAEHEHRELLILGELLQHASQQLGASVQQSLGEYGGLQVEKAVMIAAHAHIIEFGLLAMMMAIVQPYVYLPGAWRRRLVRMLLLGATVLPVAVFSEMWYGLLAGGVADFAGLLLIVSLFAMLMGVIRHTGKVDAREGETT